MYMHTHIVHTYVHTGTHRVEERAIPFARLNNVEVLFILLPLLRKNAPERMFALSLMNRFYC